MRAPLVALTLLLTACASERDAEKTDGWFDEGDDLYVEEPIDFTTKNYDFPADEDDGIAAMLDATITGSNSTQIYAPDDANYDDGADCASSSDDDLPWEIEGMVTIHPRLYFKTNGCFANDPNGYSDEKYYGSFFVQDRTGGVFVLGDSKVAHFDMGDKVRMKVRGVKTAFDLNMVIAHDIVEVEREAGPIFYEEADDRFGDDDIAEVKRVEGVVTSDKDTFGEFFVETDDGERYSIGLDVELNRRGIEYPIGTRVIVTGPVIYSFSTYQIIVMRVGQVQVVPSTDVGG